MNEKRAAKLHIFIDTKIQFLFIEDEVPDYLPTIQSSVKQICFHTFSFEFNLMVAGGGNFETVS